MRITRVEAIPVGLPLAHPVMMGGRRYERSESLLVHIACGDGAEGWGEAAPHSGDSERLAALLAQAKSAAPLLQGEKLSDRAQLVARLAQELRCSPRVVAAFEIALADAFGRANGLPICDLYGGARRNTFAQKWLLGSKHIDDDLANAARCVGQGISLLMLKVGSKPIEQDVMLARRLREMYGDRVQLCADANGSWTNAQAISYLDRVRDLGLLYLEQPRPPGELADAAAIMRTTAMPLSLDEGATSTTDILAAWQARATSGVIIKPSKFGGLARAIEAGTLCAALGLEVGLATPMAESSIGTAAALHVGAVLPRVAWEIGPSSDYLAEDLVEEPIRHVAGRLHLASGPGLGVEVSRRQVKRCRLECS